MKIKKISSVKRLVKALDSCKVKGGNINELFGSRDIFRDVVGEPDAFAVFSYLFTRFGAPTITNSTDPDILFEYDFLVDGVLVSIHAVTGKSVYFDAYVPGLAADAYLKHFCEFKEAQIIRLHAKGVPCATGYLPGYGINESYAKRNIELWMDVAQKCLTKEEYGFICGIQDKVDSDNCGGVTNEEWERAYAIARKVNEPIFELMDSDISSEERDLFYPMFGRKAFPDIASVVEAFCRELLTSVSVRDQSIDVTGVRR